MRKSPVKHKVHKHTRKTKKGQITVKQHVRGKGTRTSKLANPKLKTEEFNLSQSYWNEKGEFDKEHKILWEKYVPDVGMNLTDNKKANSAIKALIKAAKKYYRFYNDGDPIPSLGIYKYNADTASSRRKLEDYMSRAILRAWKTTKNGTLPIIGYDPDIYKYMSAEEKQRHIEAWKKKRTMSPKEYEKWRITESWRRTNKRYLLEQIKEFKRAISGNDKSMDLKYMKKNLPIMLKVLEEKEAK